MKRKALLDNRIFAVILAVFCTLLWGTAFPFIKLGYSSFAIADNDIGAKLLFAGLRFTIAGVMVWIVTAFFLKSLPKLKKTELAPTAILGVVQTTAQYLFTYIGIGFTSGTNTSVITACASFFTVLAAPIFFKDDKITPQKILGCALGFLGVTAINGVGEIGIDTIFGDSMILMSTVSAAAGNIISKKVAANINPVKLTAFQLIIGGIILTVLGLLFGGRLKFSNIQSVAVLLWLAFVSAAAFAIWTALLKHHPASMITVFNLLVPVFGTLLSGILLGENVFGLKTFVSLLLISFGIAIVNIAGKTKRRLKNEN